MTRATWAWALVVCAACRETPTPKPTPTPIPTPPPTPTPRPTPTPPPTLSLPPHATEWCIDGLDALDDETCVVIPAKPSRELLVYLHGITPPLKESPQKTTVQTTVKNASLRAGVVAIVPRGRRGIGPDGAKDWWAWPTSADAHAKYASEIVASFVRAREKLEALAGARFEKTYLAGSSNGAYFLTALALRGDLARYGFGVDGLGAMSGGGTGGVRAESLAEAKPIATYVGFGTYDENTKKNALALVQLLTAAKWPVKRGEHPVSHGAKEVYLDEAFAFFREAR